MRVPQDSVRLLFCAFAAMLVTLGGCRDRDMALQADRAMPAVDHEREIRRMPVEFRIVNWNAAGVDPTWAVEDKHQKVAAVVLEFVNELDANVITLQEVSDESVELLVQQLGRGWTHLSQRFGRDNIATFVRGRSTEHLAKPLSGPYGTPVEHRWWGYVQLRYFGTLITNVHTKCGGAGCPTANDVHVPELHANVQSGIVAGDFNTETPGWHQTDSTGEVTLWTQSMKVDHVVTVEPPTSASGDAIDQDHPLYGVLSNHRVLLTRVTLGPARLDRDTLGRRRIPQRRFDPIVPPNR